MKSPVLAASTALMLLFGLSYLGSLGYLGHLGNSTVYAQSFGPSCETTPGPNVTLCPTNTPSAPRPTLPVTAGPMDGVYMLFGFGGLAFITGSLGILSFHFRKNL